MDNEKKLLEILSEILNEFQQSNNCVIICDLDITYIIGGKAYTFDGAHFTETMRIDE